MAFRREFGAAVGISPSNPTSGARIAIHGLRAEMNDRCRVLRATEYISNDVRFGAPNLGRIAGGKRTIHDHIAVPEQAGCLRRIRNPSMTARNALPAQESRAAAISAYCDQLNVLARGKQQAQFRAHLAVRAHHGQLNHVSHRPPQEALRRGTSSTEPPAPKRWARAWRGSRRGNPSTAKRTPGCTWSLRAFAKQGESLSEELRDRRQRPRTSERGRSRPWCVQRSIQCDCPGDRAS